MIVIRLLRWTDKNIQHIAKHKVTPDEVEQVCQADPVERKSYDERILLIGQTEQQRMVSVALDPEGEGVYYPVSARDSSRKERRMYRVEKGGEAAWKNILNNQVEYHILKAARKRGRSEERRVG